jgi:periplasmic protein TonB
MTKKIGLFKAASCISLLSVAAFTCAGADARLEPVSQEAKFSAELLDVSSTSVPPKPKAGMKYTYPKEMLKTKISGQAVVDFVVNKEGKPEQIQVTSATNGYFAETAKKAVAAMEFTPAQKEGEPVAVKMQRTVKFKAPDENQRPPQLKTPLKLRYPMAMKRRGIEGTAMVSFVVDEKGRPRDIVVTEATNAEFAEAATEAISNLRYEPAVKDGKPVKTNMQQPVIFNLGR